MGTEVTIWEPIGFNDNWIKSNTSKLDDLAPSWFRKREKLKEWFESLDQSIQIKVALECIEELILTETINYYEDTDIPYWDANGNNIDGSNKSY